MLNNSRLNILRPIFYLERNRPFSRITELSTGTSGTFSSCRGSACFLLTALPPLRHQSPLRSSTPLDRSYLQQNRFYSSSRRIDLLAITNGSGRDRRQRLQEWHSPDFMEGLPVEEKEAWLRTLLQLNPDLVDTEAYLVVLRALAQTKGHPPDAALRAERWLARLEAQDGSNNALCQLTSECYQRVIETWASAVHEDPVLLVTRAQRWLDKILSPPFQQRGLADTACLNAFLDACSKGRGLKDVGSKVPGLKGSGRLDLVRIHAQKAQETVEYMIDHRHKNDLYSTISPDRDSFNYLIRAWTRCRLSLDVADRAMDALRMMEDYQSTVDPAVCPNSKSSTLR